MKNVFKRAKQMTKRPPSSSAKRAPNPNQAEIDEAFEAVTGHKRPSPVVLEADELAGEETLEEVQKIVDTTLADEIESQPSALLPTLSKGHAVLTLKGYTKNGKQAIYSGTATAIYISKTNFPDETVPQTLDVPGLVEGKPKAERKPKLTAEEKAQRAQERKTANAQKNADKKAAREKAKLEKKQAALREKLALLESQAGGAQPSA